MLERLLGLLGGGGGAAVDVRTVHEQLAHRPCPVLVDVRTPFEYQAGHAAGALNVPLVEVTRRLPDLVEGRACPVYLICQTGARSGTAQSALAKMGIETINVTGGMRAWRAAGLPLEP